MEKYDFIRLMLKSRNISFSDKRRLLYLATQEIEKDGGFVAKSEVDKTTDSAEKISEERPHAPKETASFLYLFNLPTGFKYLTHEYDPESEMSYEALLRTARKAFAEGRKKYNIPPSLFAFMNTMLFGTAKGKKGWMDFKEVWHKENYASEEWQQWSRLNPNAHLLANESFKKSIMAFRSTIRLALSGPETDSRMETIIKSLEGNHKEMSFVNRNLENGDFYTYVPFFEKGIGLILSDISKRSKEAKKVQISFERSIESDFKVCTIRITQYGSFSPNTLDEVINKLNNKGGDFYSIRNCLYGYCNWSVETLWNEKPFRWNILKDSEKSDIEELQSSTLPGFTHILTYYNKIK
jgi:hypothetical protein